jgi:hypothetical protein
LLREYGLTQTAFDAILADQGGTCSICAGQPDVRGWHVDHDHSTGQVRGILCGPCNTGLGHFRDDIALLGRAIDYLERHAAEDRRSTA